MRPSPAAGSAAERAATAPVGEWGRRAACAVPGLPVFVAWTFTTEDWTPWDLDATAVCRGCPVRAACAAYADATRPAVGIWGGQRHPAHRPVSDPVLRPDESTSAAVSATVLVAAQTTAA